MYAHFKLHPDFYNKPIHLTTEQQTDPMQVVTDFFNAYTLAELRQALYHLACTALTTDNPIFDTAEPRDHISHLVYELELVLEACYIISKGPG